MAENIGKLLTLAAQSAATVVKCLLKSRPVPGCDGVRKPGALVVLGNGPSLRDMIDNHGDFLSGRDLLAVNFFALTPDFRNLRPGDYVLADPHFFDGAASDKRVGQLHEAIAASDWPMTLHVPADRLALASTLFGARGNITLKGFNLTPAEGFENFRHFLYRTGMAMPRPRNVLIPSLMIALREGYSEIFVAGADHSWSRTLWVDDDNCVVSVQPHFYPDNADELNRVRSEYKGYHLHDILGSLTVAFRSYFDIAAYAATLGARIVNITPGSFIDAFPRMKL